MTTALGKLPKPVYEPVDGSRLSKRDALVVGTELRRIEKANGSIRPETVLEWARSPESALHGYFEWNDKKAAEEQRLDRARYLIRSVQVRIISEGTSEPIRVRAFVKASEPTKGSSETGFIGVVRAMTDEQYRREVVTRALKELQDWQKRYDSFSELAEVFTAATNLRRKYG